MPHSQNQLVKNLRETHRYFPGLVMRGLGTFGWAEVKIARPLTADPAVECS
jgi:hypothetical protein